jgi:hypothetical protein
MKARVLLFALARRRKRRRTHFTAQQRRRLAHKYVGDETIVIWPLAAAFDKRVARTPFRPKNF